MILGGVSFLFAGFSAVLLDENTVSKDDLWAFLVFYFLIYGLGRGVWESTNKAIVAEYFPDKDVVEVTSYNEEQENSSSSNSGSSSSSNSNSNSNSKSNSNSSVDTNLNHGTGTNCMNLRDAAYAAVYFTSGLTGAIAYLSFRYMTKGQLIALNTIVPIVALYCFHRSYSLHMEDKQQERERQQREEGGNGAFEDIGDDTSHARHDGVQ